jgi:hypothetical protein
MRFNQEDLFDELAPEGTYVARIVAAREKESRRGHPMVVVSLRLQGRKGAGRAVTDYFVIDGVPPAALAVSRRRLLVLCRSCGLDPPADDELDLKLLADRLVEVDVSVEQGERGPRNVVQRYRQAPSDATT